MRGNKKVTTCLLLCFLLISTAYGMVTLPHLISDDMVLQRGVAVKVWGWASPGERVTIQFNNKTYQCATGSNGKWLSTLAPMQAGGPYIMQINGSNQIILNNILIGDVWVCSGQSNMVLPMERVKERYPDDIAQSTNPMIRQFLLPVHYNFNKEEDDVQGSWQQANPKTVLQFTAAGYFFAKALFDKYHVPIGLVNASVGGSPVEAWLSEDALKQFPSLYAVAQQCKDSAYVDSIKQADKTTTTTWNDYVNTNDKGLHDTKPWFDTGYNPQGWQTMQVPGYWTDNGLTGINGAVWFRKEINIPTAMIGMPAKLWLGRIVDMDVVYINGVQYGTTGYQYPPRRYELPAGVLKPGKNVIVVRIVNNAGKGGFVLDKPYNITVAGQTIDLRGDWQFKLGVSSAPMTPTTFFQYKPEGLFNGMVAPLLSYTIKGVIWYQGESNASTAFTYAQVFSAMIKNWRQHWAQGDFPFLYVQLANFMETKSQPAESEWAQLREAQLKTLTVPNTAMAVAIDLGEWNDIHPLEKKRVGERLALAARHLAYGDKKLEYMGPVYTSAKMEGNKVIISFAHTGTGLVAKGGRPLKYFAIAGADKKFVWANTKIIGNAVFVWSDAVPHPVTVRYAWADNPDGANLYNKEGLPASPFQTGE